ncbi:MAG: hypothetical protein LBB22_03375, partial [Treponema sp.]|nr:hypothetical protein [Treponema sp.]
PQRVALLTANSSIRLFVASAWRLLMEFAPQRVALLTANSSIMLFTANSGLRLFAANSGRVENSLPVYTAAYPVPLLVIGEV